MGEWRGSRHAPALLPVMAGTAILAALIAPPAKADWKSTPVVPRLGTPTQKRLLATLRRGRALGRRADVVAKVGDSISQSPAFLQPLGCGQWRLGGHRGLRQTIRHFSRRSLPGASSECGVVNSFSRNSVATLASKPSAWAIETGEAADPTCRADESPLACEVRLDRPAYAVVLLGTNDVTIGAAGNEDPLAAFLNNMSLIARALRRHGVVPILNTIPPRADSAENELSTERLNAGLTQLAADLYVPLINLWRALDPLPDHGLADSLHLSVSGWPGCARPCDPSTCAPRCFAANFSRAGLRYGSDMRNLITLRTLGRMSKISARR